MAESQITFEKGIYTAYESSVVQTGYCTECDNWVPEATGGLRARGSWTPSATTSQPASRKGRGIGIFSRVNDPSIVQASSVWFSGASMSGTITPSVSWTIPTTVGNTLVAVVGMETSIPGQSITFTSTGWTARNALPTSSATATMCGIYELVTTQAYSGAFTPFTYAAGSSTTLAATVFILELTGVGAFEQAIPATQAMGNNGTATYTQAAGGTTAQASSLLLGFTSALGTSRTSAGTAFTSSTTSTGFHKITEGRQSNWPNAGYRQCVSAFWNAVRTAGAYSYSSTVSNGESTGTTGQSVVFVSYLGWNDAAVISDVSSDAYFVGNDNGTTLDVYRISPARTLGSAVTTAAATAVGTNTDGLPIAFVRGLGKIWFTHPSFTNVRYHNGDTGLSLSISGSPIGARSITAHLNRIWAAGASATPSRASFSEVGDGTTWSGGTAGYVDVGTEDGEPIECIVTAVGGLLIGKENSLWFLSGSTEDTFDLVPLTGGGAAPGQTLIPTPYGTFIIGRHAVYWWLGVADTTRGATSATVSIISQPIESTYGMTGNFMYGSYIDDHLYVCDEGSGTIWAYSIAGKSWRTETVDEAPACLLTYAGNQVFVPDDSTIASLVNYRSFPHPTRAHDFSPLEETFHLRTPDYQLAPPNRAFVVRHLTFKLRQRGGDNASAPIQFTAYYDGVADTDDIREIQPLDTPAVFEHRIDLGRDARSFGFALDQTLAAGDGALFDIEEIWCEYDVTKPR